MQFHSSLKAVHPRAGSVPAQAPPTTPARMPTPSAPPQREVFTAAAPCSYTAPPVQPRPCDSAPQPTTQVARVYGDAPVFRSPEKEFTDALAEPQTYVAASKKVAAGVLCVLNWMHAGVSRMNPSRKNVIIAVLLLIFGVYAYCVFLDTLMVVQAEPLVCPNKWVPLPRCFKAPYEVIDEDVTVPSADPTVPDSVLTAASCKTKYGGCNHHEQTRFISTYLYNLLWIEKFSSVGSAVGEFFANFPANMQGAAIAINSHLMTYMITFAGIAATLTVYLGPGWLGIVLGFLRGIWPSTSPAKHNNDDEIVFRLARMLAEDRKQREQQQAPTPTPPAVGPTTATTVLGDA